MQPGRGKEQELRRRLRRRINGRYLTTDEKSLLFFVLREYERGVCSRKTSDGKRDPLYEKGLWLLNEVDYYVRPKGPMPADEAFHSLGLFLLAEIDRKVDAEFEKEKRERREKVKRRVMKIIHLIRKK